MVPEPEFVPAESVIVLFVSLTPVIPTGMSSLGLQPGAMIKALVMKEQASKEPKRFMAAMLSVGR